MKRLRADLDLTQEALAQQAGCALQTIRSFELGKRRPSRELAERLADALRVSSEQRAEFVRLARSSDGSLPAQPVGHGGAQVDAAEGGTTSRTGLPTGTVTFLFTDIESSTALWETDPAAMRAALQRHDALVEATVARHHGTLVRPRGEGDSRFAVFARATDAVGAAAALQQALAAEPWSTPSPLRVRMALHTGEVDLREGDYYGSAVNRCARLRGVAHGRQTLISLATQELVRDQLPPGVELRDLGAHRLKDLQRPERLFQLCISGVPDDFPPLTTLDARPNNLPLQPTTFLGREREVMAVRQRLLLPEVRLLTLTGPGGTGKTRLAIQVAGDLLDAFADGVWFIDLAPISEPVLVLSAVATILGVKEVGGEPLDDSLKAYLREKQLLLVLDNFEQVVVAAPLVAGLLTAAAGLKVLVTSREVLHLYGEQEYAVPPLALPTMHAFPPLEQLTQYASVELFIQRAQAVQPDFHVTNATAPAVAEICVRLDGLPLALELAAVRSKVFSPQALLERLTQGGAGRLQTLTGGPRDRTARQQTLRNTIAWSYSLLPRGEQRLFARLGVFVGGCTLEAAEAVVNLDGDCAVDVMEDLVSLVDKSLLRQVEQEQGGPRFVMLETIREFALERLEESGDFAWLRQKHAEYCLAFAETAEAHLEGAQQASWLDRLEGEYGNLRFALEWAVTRSAVEIAWRLSGALWPFWEIRGYLSEGRSWLEAALAVDEGRREPKADIPKRHGGEGEDEAPASSRGALAARAKALIGAGTIAQMQGDYVRAPSFFNESLALLRDLGDKRALNRSLKHLAWFAHVRGDYERAAALWDESLTESQALNDAAGIALARHGLGEVALVHGDYGRAGQLLEASLAVFREVGDTADIAMVLRNLGELAQQQGDVARARRMLNESLALFRNLGDTLGIAMVLAPLGAVAQQQGDHGQAQSLLDESLRLSRNVGAEHCSAIALALLGETALAEDDLERAEACFREGVALFRKAGDNRGIVTCLEGLGEVAWKQGQRQAGLWQSVARGARLHGAAEKLRMEIGVPIPPARRGPQERRVAAARGLIAGAVFMGAWAEGRAMTLEQVVAYALAEDAAYGRGSDAASPRHLVDTPGPTSAAGSNAPLGLAMFDTSETLTERELEVLRLLAAGRSNQAIAEELVVAVGTVKRHLNSIFGKLGVQTRLEAATRARDRGLV
ncbi:MAG: tetratricopeptide repeat protein [Chloroflexota bacterium]|nr:tetratricopeptide repeat protein [Chloroflexota bacterium]